jgi:hypothetical protein
MAAATWSSGGVFTTAIMASVADVALPVSGFIRVEVVECALPASRQRAHITVMGIKAVVYVTVEAARTVEPGASSDEHPSAEPIRTVITVRSAAVGGIVEVSIRTDRCHSDFDGNLRRGDRGATQQCNSSDARENESFPMRHTSLLLLLDPCDKR